MQKKLNKIAKDTNIFLRKFISRQKKTELIIAMKYGLFSGGKKIRSKILIDIGSIFNVNYKSLIILGAAVECIHAYSLIHDDLPCMDNDSIRRGKPATHIKFGESTAVLAGNSLLTLAFEILSRDGVTFKKLRSINAFSVSSLLNPPQIRCGTASIWYLFIIAAQIPTVPGLFLIEIFSRRPFSFSLYRYYSL